MRASTLLNESVILSTKFNTANIEGRKRKMIKKFLSLFLALALSIALVACGSTGSGNKGDITTRD